MYGNIVTVTIIYMSLWLQVHRAYMCSDLIADESIVDDVLADDDSEDPEIDFAQGLEILGLNWDQDTHEEQEIELEKAKAAAASVAAAAEAAAAAAAAQSVTSQESSLEELENRDYPSEEIDIVPSLESIEPIQMPDTSRTLIPVAVKVTFSL